MHKNVWSTSEQLITFDNQNFLSKNLQLFLTIQKPLKSVYLFVKQTLVVSSRITLRSTVLRCVCGFVFDERYLEKKLGTLAGRFRVTTFSHHFPRMNI